MIFQGATNYIFAFNKNILIFMSKLLLFVSYFVYPSFQGTIFTLLIFEFTVYCKSSGLNWFNFKFEQKWSTYLLSHTSSTFWQLDRMLYSLVTDEEKTIFLNVLIKATLYTVTSLCHFSFQVKTSCCIWNKFYSHKEEDL